jgi:hypothetical protein
VVPNEKFPLSCQHCLAHAVTCEEMAEQPEFAANKAILLKVAECWRMLAVECGQPPFHRVSRGIGSPSPE